MFVAVTECIAATLLGSLINLVQCDCNCSYRLQQLCTNIWAIFGIELTILGVSFKFQDNSFCNQFLNLYQRRQSQGRRQGGLGVARSAKIFENLLHKYSPNQS